MDSNGVHRDVKAHGLSQRFIRVYQIRYHMAAHGFPAVTTKKLAYQSHAKRRLSSAFVRWGAYISAASFNVQRGISSIVHSWRQCLGRIYLLRRNRTLYEGTDLVLIQAGSSMRLSSCQSSDD